MVEEERKETTYLLGLSICHVLPKHGKFEARSPLCFCKKLRALPFSSRPRIDNRPRIVTTKPHIPLRPAAKLILNITPKENQTKKRQRVLLFDN